MTTTETEADLAVRSAVRDYEHWLYTWSELTMRSSGTGATPHGQLLPLTEDQRDAYLTLPYVLEELERAWAALPDDVRPSHFTARIHVQ